MTEELLQNIENTKKAIKKDLSNQRFGMLFVEYSLRKNGRIYYHCRCDCGNEKDIRADVISRGVTRACGCQMNTRIDLVGKTFGFLTVLEMLPLDMCKCQCKCGKIINVLGHNLKRHNTESCGCILNRSKGETKIKALLEKHQIAYNREIKFDTLIGAGKRHLRFDFGIYNENQILYAIEFDGEQHFNQANAFGGKNLQENDKIKNEWCKANNIPLIRIPYTHLQNLTIEDLMLETSKFII